MLKFNRLRNFIRVYIDGQKNYKDNRLSINTAIRNILQQVPMLLKFACTIFLFTHTKAIENDQTATLLKVTLLRGCFHVF